MNNNYTTIFTYNGDEWIHAMGNNMNGWGVRREDVSARSLPSCLLFIELLPGFGLATEHQELLHSWADELLLLAIDHGRCLLVADVHFAQRLCPIRQCQQAWRDVSWNFWGINFD